MMAISGAKRAIKKHDRDHAVVAVRLERKYADREERDPCQAGTVGCCVDHTPDDDEGCEAW